MAAITHLFYLIATSLLIVAPALHAQAFDLEHKDWSEVLKKSVRVKESSSQVDYRVIQRDPLMINRYLKNISQFKKSDFEKLSREDQMAFYINAYNAFTIKLILDHYPVTSIKKIGSVFSSPWKMKFFKIFGKETTLDEIEHEILRKQYPDPRVHFAVNCASIGCPALRNEAYVGARLNEQLNEQTKIFLRDTSRNYLDHKKKKAHVSKIFSWFSEDFTKNGSSIQKFIAPYITDDPEVRSALEKGAYDLSYTDYDWDLNGTKP